MVIAGVGHVAGTVLAHPDAVTPSTPFEMNELTGGGHRRSPRRDHREYQCRDDINSDSSHPEAPPVGSKLVDDLARNEAIWFRGMTT